MQPSLISGLHGSLNKLGISDVATNGAINFFAGASAALASQIAYVPIDVVSLTPPPPFVGGKVTAGESETYGT